MKKPRLRRQPAAAPQVSVIIPVLNEHKTLARVIRQAYQVHPHTEVIVVANGSTDGTRRIAQQSGARVISFDEPLGHDVGRSIGAMQARGGILLFLDGDFVVPVRSLKPLVKAVASGVDVALNSHLGPVHRGEVHPVVLAKHVLNAVLARHELKGASMTTIPHAMSRRALETIGAEYLAIPPLAQAIALQKGLNVKAVHYINVSANPRRRKRQVDRDPLAHLIIGDHLEAMNWYLGHTNERGYKSDFMRRREIVR